MKHSPVLYTFIAILTVLFFPPSTFAAVDVNVSGNGAGSESHVSVNQQSEGQSTVCVNGKCTTSGGDNKATVCINGECKTTEGNVDMKSDDENSQVHIRTNSSDTTTQSAESKTGTASDDIKDATPSVHATITPDPTIMQMREDINNKVKEQTDAVKEHVKQQEAAISSFVKSEMESLNIFLNSLFQ